jgi:hypothetical protein
VWHERWHDGALLLRSPWAIRGGKACPPRWCQESSFALHSEAVGAERMCRHALIEEQASCQRVRALLARGKPLAYHERHEARRGDAAPRATGPLPTGGHPAYGWGLRSLRRPCVGTPHDVGVLTHFCSRVHMRWLFGNLRYSRLFSYLINFQENSEYPERSSRIRWNR